MCYILEYKLCSVREVGSHIVTDLIYRTMKIVNMRLIRMRRGGGEVLWVMLNHFTPVKRFTLFQNVNIMFNIDVKICPNVGLK